MRALPNFMCLGTQKAGTTTLHDILKLHPEVFLPVDKEAHFFHKDELFSKGVNWWLQEYFTEYAGEKVMGVFTPDYMFFEDAILRIRNELGRNIKILIVLRNPVERAFSHYLMSKRRGYETLSFLDALAEESKRLDLGIFERRHFSYVARGRYYHQLVRLVDNFGLDNLLILNFERDICQNLSRSVEAIQEFLGVAQVDLDVNVVSNSASEARFKFVSDLFARKSRIKTFVGRTLPLELKRKIMKYIDEKNRVAVNFSGATYDKSALALEYFRDDIEALEVSFGLDLAHWYRN